MKNWIPYEIGQSDGEWEAKWLFLGEQLFLEPFFEETIRICRRMPENKGGNQVSTPLRNLKIVADELETVAPTAFIFHISRCGSTLLTQLLSLQKENIVISEAPVFDSILRWKHNNPEIPANIRRHHLENTTRIYGQKRNVHQVNYFIKWDSWHLFFLDEIRAIYPSTPFIFMTRDMDAVINSHEKVAGMHAIRGVLEPVIFGYALQDVLDMQPQAYLENLLLKMLDTVHGFMAIDNNSLLLNYEDGMFPNFEATSDFLNMRLNKTALENVMQRLKYHSKFPKEQFEATA